MHAEIRNIIQQLFCMPTQQTHVKPSTLAVATWRAAHQVLDQPPIFEDPLALKILGEEEIIFLTKLDAHHNLLGAAMRIAIAARSRFAEDEFLASGIDQYVILGAGLDTYAYRSLRTSERVFEVDHPSTQAIKKELLRENNITSYVPVNYVGCDFENNSLQDCLVKAGLDFNKKAYFSWLGVVPYLSEAAIAETLGVIARCTPGTQLVFDYMVDPNLLTEIEQSVLSLMGEQLASGGEPLMSFFSPEKMRSLLLSAGFTSVQPIDAAYLNDRYLANLNYPVKIGRVTQMMLAKV